MYRFKLRATDVRIMRVPGWSAKTAFAYVPITAFPSKLREWMDINPRQPKLRNGLVVSGVGPEITGTIADDANMLVQKSRGVTMIASTVKDGEEGGGNKYLEITFTDPNLHGISDGGHTLFCSLSAIDNPDDFHNNNKAFVLVQVRTGIDDQETAIEITDGLNKSLQVDERSIQNLHELFEPIKQAMRGAYGENRISYFQNELDDDGHTRNVPVERILGLLAMLNRERYPGDGNGVGQHPTGIYRQSGRLIEDFKQDIQKPWFAQMVTHLPSITALSSKIKADIRPIYNAAGGAYGKRGDVKSLKKTDGDGDKVKRFNPVPLPFIDEMLEQPVHDGWVLPILAAFRANISFSDNKFKWEMNLNTIYEMTKSRLVQQVLGLKAPPSEIGRDKEAYQSLFQIVDSAILRHKLSKMI